MTKINELAAVDAVSDGDQFAIWSTVNGDSRRAPASVVKAYVSGGARVLATAYASPSASGFTVTLTGTGDVWLVMTPSAGYAAGAIVMPPAPVDRQLVTVSCSQAVTALTVSAADTVRGAPTALTANGFFSMRFEDVTNVWVRVG